MMPPVAPDIFQFIDYIGKLKTVGFWSDFCFLYAA